MEYSEITLTPGFIISAATDPQFNYVTALLHGDGTNTAGGGGGGNAGGPGAGGSGVVILKLN